MDLMDLAAQCESIDASGYTSLHHTQLRFGLRSSSTTVLGNKIAKEWTREFSGV